MDYRNIFESALSAAQENSRLPDDERFIQLVKERTDNMKKTRFKWRKLAVIAASLAAAAALTVSVGAALNWDITTLFMDNNAAEREKRAKLTEQISAPANVSVPEGAGRSAADPQKEYEVLRNISHELDMTVDYDEYILHIDGYSFDGSTLKLLYDITYKNGYEDIEKRRKDGDHIDFNPFCMQFTDADGNLMMTGSSGGPTTDYDSFGDNITFSCEISCTQPVMEKPLTTDTGVVTVYDIRTVEDIIEEGTVVTSFEVDLTYDSVSYIELDTDITGTTPRGKEVRITKVRLSPQSITAWGTSDLVLEESDTKFQELHQIPVYITYNDGTVIDISGYASSSTGQTFPDSNSYSISVSTEGNVLDIDNIKSIQIYNNVIELDK